MLDFVQIQEFIYLKYNILMQVIAEILLLESKSNSTV